MYKISVSENAVVKPLRFGLQMTVMLRLDRPEPSRPVLKCITNPESNLFLNSIQCPQVCVTRWRDALGPNQYKAFPIPENLRLVSIGFES